mmetsp:Transcript_11583/g.24716  ORF Transcript_11583/g.24716 Transcript_11583/m.24716 type:complete len:346 (+) Transcript_11583:305-1342(+)|eukprot:CAMPEP_0183739510 /NCGR_PEP_ID=MMETSP0737-20130205/57237_1 /TAXON_ID=385413 /ORGANISM="Thalassiosira miniscula, Strain CCMP1093" /LENGTH=345 /DNA_ID=CAMNT_0025974333 /DNA_START=298 /DNA_END=1335 /DNA_ORIENTATION=-
MDAFGNNSFSLEFPPTNALRSPKSPSRKSKSRPFEELFPSKLYEMLEEIEALGLADAVSWRPHGRAFFIKDKDLFITKVVPKFFKATKIRSFQRQCHLWGFQRITSGPDAGSWWHKSFIRGNPQDLRHIVRTRVKGMASSMIHVPEFNWDEFSSIQKNAPRTDVPNPKTDINYSAVKSEDVSSLSKNSSSDKCDEFERLDEEFESLFDRFDHPGPRRVSIVSPPSEANSKSSLFAQNISNLDLNCISNNNGWNYTLKKKETNWAQSLTEHPSTRAPSLTSSVGQNTGFNQPFPSYVIAPQQQRSMGAHVTGHTPIICCSENALSVQEEADADEFSDFIEKMIQQP